jgi:hypothetical protein
MRPFKDDFLVLETYSQSYRAKPDECSASSEAGFSFLAKNSFTKVLDRKVNYHVVLHPVCGSYK